MEKGDIDNFDAFDKMKLFLHHLKYSPCLKQSCLS